MLRRARLRDCMSSVRLSVTFRYRDHTRFNTSKVISRPNSLRWMTLNGRNVALAEMKSSYGAHHKNFNEDRPIISAATCRLDVNGISSHSYGVSLAIWDHTVLPATRHK